MMRRAAEVLKSGNWALDKDPRTPHQSLLIAVSASVVLVASYERMFSLKWILAVVAALGVAPLLMSLAAGVARERGCGPRGVMAWACVPLLVSFAALGTWMGGWSWWSATSSLVLAIVCVGGLALLHCGAVRESSGPWVCARCRYEAPPPIHAPLQCPECGAEWWARRAIERSGRRPRVRCVGTISALALVGAFAASIWYQTHGVGLLPERLLVDKILLQGSLTESDRLGMGDRLLSPESREQLAQAAAEGRLRNGERFLVDAATSGGLSRDVRLRTLENLLANEPGIGPAVNSGAAFSVIAPLRGFHTMEWWMRSSVAAIVESMVIDGQVVDLSQSRVRGASEDGLLVLSARARGRDVRIVWWSVVVPSRANLVSNAIVVDAEGRLVMPPDVVLAEKWITTIGKDESISSEKIERYVAP